VMSMSVCLSARISPEPHARPLPIFVHVAYVRGSVLLPHVDDRPHRLSAGRGGGDGVHSAGEVYSTITFWKLLHLLSKIQKLFILLFRGSL